MILERRVFAKFVTAKKESVWKAGTDNVILAPQQGQGEEAQMMWKWLFFWAF
jgi:hypothetical protein